MTSFEFHVNFPCGFSREYLYQLYWYNALIQFANPLLEINFVNGVVYNIRRAAEKNNTNNAFKPFLTDIYPYLKDSRTNHGKSFK